MGTIKLVAREDRRVAFFPNLTMKIFTLSVVTFSVINAQRLKIGDLSYCERDSCTDRAECAGFAVGRSAQWVRNVCAKGHRNNIPKNREWFGECCKTCCDVLEKLRNNQLPKPEPVKTTTTTTVISKT